MSSDLIVNGFRIDEMNNLNYTKLISDNLYIGFLNRNNIPWGDAVLFGISFNSSLLIDAITELIPNEEMSGENIYATLYQEGQTAAGTVSSSTIFWKLRRVNYKWVLVESKSYKIVGSAMVLNTSATTTKYLDYVQFQNLSDSTMFIQLWDMTTPASPVWLTQVGSVQKPLGIRVKNMDLDFYNSNKKVNIVSSGSGAPIDGFDGLYILENSKDSTSIKIVGVPETTIALITNGTIQLVGRYFDVIDAFSGKILIKNILFDEWIELQNITCLKFSYPTQLGEKVVLVTTNMYEGVFQVYPDFSIDLVTELVNDNMPPGLDITYMIDNFVLDSLFLKDYDGDGNGLNDLNFIKNHQINPTTQVKFVSLANSVNSIIDNISGEYLDNSVYVGFANTSTANWNSIKEYNLNKLFLTYELVVSVGSSLPGSGTAGDLFYLNTIKKLYIYESSTWVEISNEVRQIAIFYIENKDTVDEFIDLVYINNINKINIMDSLTIQLVI